MVYKLSNVVERDRVEKELDVEFKYPNLYVPRLVINGLQETNLSIITEHYPNELDIAIWGLLPSNYKEDWSSYQNVANTLNVSLEQLKAISWLRNTLKERRCLVLTSGFFCYQLRRNKVYTYYLSMPNEEPFYLGGIYNKLDDGFLSCALITTKPSKFISSIHNIDNAVPLVITKGVKETWLSANTEKGVIDNIIKNPPNPRLRANPIANDFFKNDIINESLLQPVYYDDLTERGNPSS